MFLSSSSKGIVGGLLLETGNNLLLTSFNASSLRVHRDALDMPQVQTHGLQCGHHLNMVLEPMSPKSRTFKSDTSSHVQAPVGPRALPHKASIPGSQDIWPGRKPPSWGGTKRQTIVGYAISIMLGIVIYLWFMKTTLCVLLKCRKPRGGLQIRRSRKISTLGVS